MRKSLIILTVLVFSLCFLNTKSAIAEHNIFVNSYFEYGHNINYDSEYNNAEIEVEDAIMKLSYEYRNVCWRCSSSISSNYCRRCTRCGWYICRACKACNPNCSSYDSWNGNSSNQYNPNNSNGSNSDSSSSTEEDDIPIVGYIVLGVLILGILAWYQEKRQKR